MHTINILTTIFNFPIALQDAVHLKKAISSAIHDLREKGETNGIATDLFYNRDDETGNSENRYPLIQYTSVNGKAAITAINEGAQALGAVLSLLHKESNRPFNKKFLITKQNPIDLSDYTLLPLKKHKIELLTGKHQYLVKDWLPLDTNRYKAWTASGELKMLAEILDECLPRQLSNMIEGVGYPYSFPFITHTCSILTTKEKIQVYEEKKIPFDCTFYCNVRLPDGIGIGQVPGIGFGRISRYEK